MSGIDSKGTAKEFFEKAFETSVDGILILDEKGNIREVNPASSKIYGYSEGELRGMHISRLRAVGEKVDDVFRDRHLRKLNEQGGDALKEVIDRRKDGSPVIIERSYNLIRDEAGKILGGLIILRDVTHRKRLEREIKESEEKYRDLFETANDGIISTDESNAIVSINGRARQILGYEQDELLGKSATILMPSRYREAHENALKRISTTGQSSTVGKVFEIEMARKDGSEVHVEATYSVAKKGEDSTLAIIFRDVSERKLLEERIIRSERLKALGEMARGVAHDFNNLLTTILGRTQLLKLKLEGYQNGERRQSSKYLIDGLQIIENAAVKGAEAVRLIQEFTRITSNTEEFTEVGVTELIDDVIEYTKPYWKGDVAQEEKRVSIIKHSSNALLPVNGNPSELREVLANIIKNSIDAMPEGGDIIIRTSLEYGFVVISIKDSGHGMSQTVCEKIFDPFFTTRGPQRMGLGMSVSYGIIRRHEGEIAVQSEEGKGTRVILKIPVAQGHKGKVETSGTSLHGDSVRVLVIDDEEGVRSLLGEVIKEMGHDVSVAPNGEEGLRLFTDGSFDMVITDLSMPGISGWEVARRVKELDARVPVALITGWGVQLDEGKKRAHGIDCVVSKPFNISHVIELVRERAHKIRLP